MPQALIAELFQITVPTVNEHLKGIFCERELEAGATIRKFRIVRQEGSRKVSREIEHYSLSAILVVGYRVRSPRGTQFRRTCHAEPFAIMNQIVTVARIAGEASTVVTRLFQDWSDSRVLPRGESALMEPEQWTANRRAEMRRFAGDLRSNLGRLPVVFYSEYLDMWSMGDVFRNAFPKDGNTMYEVMPDNALSLLCYALPDGNALDDHLRRERRRKQFAEETKWYLRVLQEGAFAWRPLVENATIVVLRQIIGGLVTDEEVEQTSRV